VPDPRKRSAFSLPAGRHLVVTWGIPDNFGGMTAAFLHRSRAFVRLAGVSVDVLTFDTRADYPALERDLRRSGELVEGMRILNLWDWLRDWEAADDAPGSLSLDSHPSVPLASEDGFPVTRRGDRVLTRTRLAEDGSTALQVDHYRLDGTLLLTDQRDGAVRGELGGRSIVLYDRTGRPFRSWGGAWALYRWWLDRVRGGTRSFIIVDSKTTANFMMGYRRTDAVVVHVVHSSHLEGQERPIAPLRASRRAVFENLNKFDAVVLLTPRQRDDVVALLGARSNLAVIPNGRDLGQDEHLVLDRPDGRGIMIASLTSRKRVDHAIRATVRAVGSVPSLSLDVFGDGALRPEFETLVDTLGAGSYVRFHGHRSEARSWLARASFLLLTSDSEGFPLVLVESMAAGCLPIAYDVPYGPADIITHGLNGMLVPAGDEDALTRAIRELRSLPARRIRAMRRRARNTAAAYDDRVITRAWATELERAAARKSGPRVAPGRVKAVLRRGKTALRRRGILAR
jgi:poly(glycerol-phosphate) alpha-glucosyltransferase